MRGILRVNAVGALMVAALFWIGVPDAPVADAASRGDVEAVLALLKQGADVNLPQGDGMTALHWAAANGNAELARILIYAGAGVGARTRNGSYAPLHLASQEEHVEVVKALLAAGADPNALTSTGAVTPLHFAAESGNVEVIMALVEHGAEVKRAERVWGHTPLMFAAAKNRAGAVAALLQRGADPEITGSVIDVIKREREDREFKKRHDEIVEVLFGEDAGPVVIRDKREAGVTASDAVIARAVQFTAAYLANRPPSYSEADPVKPRGNYSLRQTEEIRGYGGLTALTLAAREGQMEVAMALLDGGADINQAEAGGRHSPLLLAAINGYFDLAMMLLERGADPNLASDNGNTPLFATVSTEWNPSSRPPPPTHNLYQKTSYLEVMEALLKQGADVNARLKYNAWYIGLGDGQLQVDWMGATAFFRAAHAMDVAAMKLLVGYGADLNIPTIRPAFEAGVNDQAAAGQGETMAVPAVASEKVDASGLPIVPRDGPGFYPINAASGLSHGTGRQGTVHRHVEDGWLPAVRYLIEELGADPDTRDYNGDTALHKTAFRGDNEMILYLVSKGADVMVVNRKGQTTVDKANGPIQRMEPHPETIKLLESLGAKNNHNCVSC